MPQRSLPAEFGKGLFKQNAVAMGVAVIFVLACSNTLVSALRKLIPAEVRIPCFIVIIASFVTMVEIIFKGLLPPEINASLGIFIPLIVVNCIILYRAESFGYHSSALRSLLDGLGIGLGFMLAICLVASLREIIGSGTIWGYPWVPTSWSVRYVPASILIQAPGAFLVLGLLLGFFNWLRTLRSKTA